MDEEVGALPTASSDASRYAREALGITQKELADRIDVTQGFISRVEGGLKNFTIVHFEKLARVVGVPLAVLMWRASTLPAPEGEAEREIADELNRLMREVYPDHFAPSEGGKSD